MQSEHHDDEDASSWFVARWMSACEHANADERFLAQFLQQYTVIRDNLAHEKSRSQAFAVALQNARDTSEEQSSSTTSMHQSLHASLPKSNEDFSIHVSDHVFAEELVLLTNTPEHCGIIETTAREIYEDNGQVITEDFIGPGLESA